MIQKGDKIPAFTLEDQSGRTWTDKDLFGKKTVLYVYPKDSTPGCTAEACNLRDNYSRFLELGYNVLGISKDSVASHVKFAEKFSLPFPLLSDKDHVLIEALGSWGEKKFCGKVSTGTLRKTFLFNEDGVCTEVIEKVDTKNHTQQILK